MFENILGQDEIIKVITEQIAERVVPQAMLFHGSPYTGKVSAALELARVISCEGGEAVWNCGCSSCKRHRLLTHPNLMMLGSRYFGVEIAASADAFRRTRIAATRFLFVRAVRKLLRRFDPMLMANETAPARKAAETAAEIDEMLDDPQLADKTIQSIVEASVKLSGRLSSGNIPVQQVRAVASWAHTTGATKIILMENAELIQESARNALLKLVEEPPKDVFIILAATRRSSLIATLLSRLRPYRFADRDSKTQTEVLARIFREESPEYPTLREYFLAWKDLSPRSMQGLAERFLDLLLGQRGSKTASAGGQLSAIVAETLQSGNQTESLVVFVEELLAGVRRRVLEGSLSVHTAEAWANLIRDHIGYLRTYNPNAALVLESLFYRMRNTTMELA